MKKAIAVLFLLFSNLAFSQELALIKIGNQVWSQKNLDKTAFRNGEVIPEIKSKENWLKTGYREEPAWCYYDFDAKNANLGKLYNYYAVSDVRNIAPIGWRVPSFHDYYNLVNYLDPLCTKFYFTNNGSLAGGSLKSEDSLWIGTGCPQINSNFNAIPAGGFSPSIDNPKYDWDEKGEKALFWCMTNWNSITEFIDPIHLVKFNSNIQAGKLNDKAIVIRIKQTSCEIDSDDDPKLYGYSLRLIREN